MLRLSNAKLSKKMKEVLSTVRTFQDQQRKLFHKYTDLKHDHSDLLDSTKKLLWEDILDGESTKLKLGRIKKREEGLVEEDDRVGDYRLGDVLGEGQFGLVRACTDDSNKKEDELAVKIIEKRKGGSSERER